MRQEHRRSALRKLAGIFALALGLLGMPSAASPIRYPIFGVWMITQARAAPWVSPTSAWAGPESRRLIQQKVIFLWDRIDGPVPLRCDGPAYRTVDVPAAGLFEGNLTSPVLQAQMLGFHGGPVTTLQTDCEDGVDFHFVDRSTAMFALDNVIYTLRRR